MHKRILLVVDDDPNVGLLISAIFKKYNYNVVTLYTGEEVLDFLQSNKPDVILLDLKMPGLDGYTLCRKIRENQETGNIPIIVLSGVSEIDAKVTTIELGADDFITKPFDVRELRARINRIIKRKATDTSLNPLTHLPGSPAIEEEVQKRISASNPFALAYVDADNFKAYNDVYGYARGDEIIKKIANIIAENIKTYASECFVGHIGGDDFIIISKPEEAEAISKGITEEFDREIPAFYSEEDRKQGFITTVDRRQKIRHFPLMSLTIAIIVPKTAKHYAKIVEILSELKRYAKSMPDRKGSIFVKDRRN
ncbi:MAG: response regulator [Elusimicrobia bacterium]|nr:response regulator [Elusimicrobiota bacterium]